MNQEFKNEGRFSGTLIQGSEVYNAPVLKGPVYLQSRPVPAPTFDEVRAAAESFRRLPLNEVRAPAALPLGSQLSVRHNALFVGRSQDLRQLAAIIKQGEVAAVTGLGGMGK